MSVSNHNCLRLTITMIQFQGFPLWNYFRSSGIMLTAITSALPLSIHHPMHCNGDSPIVTHWCPIGGHCFPLLPLRWNFFWLKVSWWCWEDVPAPCLIHHPLLPRDGSVAFKQDPPRPHFASLQWHINGRQANKQKKHTNKYLFRIISNIWN